MSNQHHQLPIMMTGAVIGPLVFSWLADWLGVLNIVIFSVTISAALEFALLGATTSGSVIIVGLLYGFFSSGFQALLGPIFSRLSFSVTEIGHRMGLGFFVIGVGSLIGWSCVRFIATHPDCHLLHRSSHQWCSFGKRI
jgi:MCP family monocarboxylic acid transporter-like MFS transporter 10